MAEVLTTNGRLSKDWPIRGDARGGGQKKETPPSPPSRKISFTNQTGHKIGGRKVRASSKGGSEPGIRRHERLRCRQERSENTDSLVGAVPSVAGKRGREGKRPTSFVKKGEIVDMQRSGGPWNIKQRVLVSCFHKIKQEAKKRHKKRRDIYFSGRGGTALQSRFSKQSHCSVTTIRSSTADGGEQPYRKGG